VQGTVREFDPGSGSGSVFLDDGTVCPFGPEVFAASGLRLLRRGQRVAIRRGPYLTFGQVHGHQGARVGLDQVGQCGHRLLGQPHRHQACLDRVVPEDIAEARRDHRPEPVVEQRPYGVLAGRPGAEIRPGHQNRGTGRVRLVEHEPGVGAPDREQAVAEPRAGDPLQVFGRNDLIGVHVAAAQ